MIEIVYRKADNAHSLSLRGHAGYHAGNDIVCAGVSAIVFSLLGYIDNHGDEISGLRMHVDGGDTDISCREAGSNTATAFEMAVIGLAQIAKAYPDNVAITISSAIGGDSREQTARKERRHA